MTPVERAARAVSEYMICGHCDGSCEDCTREARVVFESIDVDELARALRRRAAYEGVVILDHPAQRIARDLRTYLLTGDESDE